ncbi:polyprenyl synthetase family protein [Caldisericum exile]|uniref:Geranyltranstransferase n=1 Tax=Caldisericum exile (strain DSM 21853 / NBRC 104410 / AZM16c01) TaxID=511051 RepID=A0A7U6JEX8_CALEA|nr:farnesyl diphosphate synthase [Caldisericum exile]BAL80913.1 geranyltranstransferase [Caldisericum exile AZM16c01]
MEESIKEYLEERKSVIDNYLNIALEKIREDSPLYAAINYSLMAGGKRLRPIMLIATYESNFEDYEVVLPFAASVEMIHTYSLIHDDLPILDNSDYRRGKPTCHKIYGSDMALLAGDALISLAFEIISSRKLLEHFEAKFLLRIVHDFAELSGAKGLVGGQVMDMVTMDMDEIDENLILYIEKRKTASLFILSVRVGAILSGVSEDELANLTKFAENFGISYQIQDDILDETSTVEELGKDVHQDRKNKKATFVSLYGLDRSKVLAKEYIEKANSYLIAYSGKYKLLENIAKFTLERIK